MFSRADVYILITIDSKGYRNIRMYKKANVVADVNIKIQAK